MHAYTYVYSIQRELIRDVRRRPLDSATDKYTLNIQHIALRAMLHNTTLTISLRCSILYLSHALATSLLAWM